MPRIDATNIAEHVAKQEAAVFDAAIRLFLERGYRHVSLGDIASEVGLARNSMYRYFPSKAHIVLRWFRTELVAQATRARDILESDGDPADRIDRWVLDQLDYARRPEHALIAEVTELIPDLDDDARAELAHSHGTLLAPLERTLAEAGIDDPAVRSVTADLILGVVLIAARREAGTGAEVDPVLRTEVSRVVQCMVGR